MNRPEKIASVRQIKLERRLPTYWRVTFDHPPLNIFGPETIPELEEIIVALETDAQVKVVVFDSVVEGFFLTHYNFLAPMEEHEDSARTDRFAGASGHAGASKPRASCLDSFDQRARNGSWKRACACERHALCEPRKGGSFAMGSWRWPGAGRWSDG